MKSGAKVQPFFELTKFFFLFTEYQHNIFSKPPEKRPFEGFFPPFFAHYSARLFLFSFAPLCFLLVFSIVYRKPAGKEADGKVGNGRTGSDDIVFDDGNLLQHIGDGVAGEECRHDAEGGHGDRLGDEAMDAAQDVDKYPHMQQVDAEGAF